MKRTRSFQIPFGNGKIQIYKKFHAYSRISHLLHAWVNGTHSPCIFNIVLCDFKIIKETCLLHDDI